ncbi:hypothetical protein [Kitasatospora sp. NPDC006786]
MGRDSTARVEVGLANVCSHAAQLQQNLVSGLERLASGDDGVPSSLFQ